MDGAKDELVVGYSAVLTPDGYEAGVWKNNFWFHLLFESNCKDKEWGSGWGSIDRTVTPDVRGSNPVIGKLYITYILSTVLKRRK